MEKCAARIEGGVVMRVIVIPDGLVDDTAVTEFCNHLGLDGDWVATDQSGSRGKYAGQGDLWDGEEFTSPPAPDPVFPEGS